MADEETKRTTKRTETETEQKKGTGYTEPRPEQKSGEGQDLGQKQAEDLNEADWNKREGSEADR